jgi:hypothetical protein
MIGSGSTFWSLISKQEKIIFLGWTRSTNCIYKLAKRIGERFCRFASDMNNQMVRNKIHSKIVCVCTYKKLWKNAFYTSQNNLICLKCICLTILNLCTYCLMLALFWVQTPLFLRN